MKEKKKENNEIKHIEFDKLKEIHNSYRNTVSILDTAKARILDITHELIERDGKCPKNKTQPKIGRPPKVKVLNKMNNKNIEEYFIKKKKKNRVFQINTSKPVLHSQKQKNHLNCKYNMRNNKMGNKRKLQSQ